MPNLTPDPLAGRTAQTQKSTSGAVLTFAAAIFEKFWFGGRVSTGTSSICCCYQAAAADFDTARENGE